MIKINLIEDFMCAKNFSARNSTYSANATYLGINPRTLNIVVFNNFWAPKDIYTKRFYFKYMNWKSLKFSTKGAIIGFFIALITIIISILGLTTCSAGFDCILWLWLIFPTLFFSIFLDYWDQMED